MLDIDQSYLDLNAVYPGSLRLRLFEREAFGELNDRIPRETVALF